MLNRAPSTTHLHPAHFRLHPALCNTFNVIRTKILHVHKQFLQILEEKFEVVRFTWKLTHMLSWKCWFRIQTWIFEIPSQNPFLGKFEPKESKLSILPENWHTWYLGGGYSESGLRFSKFRPQNFFLANLSRKSIPWLFSFESLLLLDILDTPSFDFIF